MKSVVRVTMNCQFYVVVCKTVQLITLPIEVPSIVTLDNIISVESRFTRQLEIMILSNGMITQNITARWPVKAPL
jgi:hypothetical protein